jgi:hypothetical protein
MEKKKCFCVDNPRADMINLDFHGKQYEFHFVKETKIKNSGILKCQDCNAFWLIDIPSNDNICYRIWLSSQIRLMEEWLANDTSASHLKGTAALIGNTSSTFVEYPCKATLKTGEVRDLCILSKWQHHPHISWPTIPVQHFLYASQVAYIQPSEFALSYNNRVAMRKADFVIHKDLVPLVFVVDNENYFHDLGSKTYYLESNFLRYQNICGSNVKSVSQDIKTYANSKIKDDLQNAVTMILFDEM